MSNMLNHKNLVSSFINIIPVEEAVLGSEGERSEPERSRTASSTGHETPDPEVVGRPVRRTFTAAYKRRILAEVDGAREAGAVGQILRREGLYSSHLTCWRRGRAAADEAALVPKKRGPKPAAKNPLLAENVELKREKVRLEKKLRRAELMLDFQKKVSQILGITLPMLAQSDDDEVSL